MTCSACQFDMNALARYTKCSLCGARVCDTNCYDDHLRAEHGTDWLAHMGLPKVAA